MTGSARELAIILKARDMASGVLNKAAMTMGGRFGKLTGTVGKLGLAFGGLYVAKEAFGAIYSGAKNAVNAFMSFDEAMNQSLAIMGDVSSTMRDQMATAAREVGKTTRISADEAAQSYYYLASAGLTAEQSIAALPQVAQFAQAGMFDMATATDLVTDAQSALGLTVDDAAANLENLTHVSDVLVKANVLANASVEQFSIALTTKAGPSMKSVGMDIEEGVAVLAAFASQGIKAEEAGTQLSIVLRDLQTKSINSEKAFKKYGVAVFDEHDNLRNMADIIGDLEGALDGMSDKAKKATLLQMGFSDKSIASMLALLGESDAIREYEDALRQAGGTTKEVADKQLESFQGKMELLKNKFHDVAIKVGEKLVPKLMEFGDWASENADGIAAAFGGIADAIVRIIDVVQTMPDFVMWFLTGKTQADAELEARKAQEQALNKKAVADAAIARRYAYQEGVSLDFGELYRKESIEKAAALAVGDYYEAFGRTWSEEAMTGLKQQVIDAMTVDPTITAQQAATYFIQQAGATLDAGKLQNVQKIIDMFTANTGPQGTAAADQLITNAKNRLEARAAEVGAKIRRLFDWNGGGGGGNLPSAALGTVVPGARGSEHIYKVHGGEAIVPPDDLSRAVTLLQQLPIWPQLTAMFTRRAGGFATSPAALAYGGAGAGGGSTRLTVEVPVVLNGREVGRAQAQTIIHNGRAGTA